MSREGMDRRARERGIPGGLRGAAAVLAVALVGLLALVAIFVGGVLGLGAPSAAKGASASSSPEPSPPAPSVVRELPALRSADSDTFLLSDGTREARVYAHAVNYRDASGQWQAIDDELKQTSDGSFEPVASPVQITLPSSLSSGPVSVGAGEDELSFSLEQASTASASAAATPAGSALSYDDVMPGVSLSYTAAPQALREVLTLESSQAPESYAFDLSYGSALQARLTPSGGVVFRDSAGKRIYTIPAPRLLEASGAPQARPTRLASYALSPDGHTLTLTLSASLIAQAGPSSPVRIDPEIFYGISTECAIASGTYENESFCGEELFVGVQGGTWSVGRSLLRFDLSSIPRDSQVLASTLKLLMYGEFYSESPLEIEAHALSSDFSEEATWRTSDGSTPWVTPGGDFEATVAGRQEVLADEQNTVIFLGFSPLVERWVQDPASNHGVLLKAADESVLGEDIFEPRAAASFAPFLWVRYAPRVGDQGEDMVTATQPSGGSEALVDVANGNLFLESPDVSYAGEGYETALTRYYNSQEEAYYGNSGFFRQAFGPRWTLSMGDTTSLESGSWWDRSAYVQEPGGAYRRFDPAPPATDATPYSSVNYTSVEPEAPEGEEPPEGPEATLALQNPEDDGTVTYSEPKASWLFSSGVPIRIEEPEGAGNTITMSYVEGPAPSLLLSHLEDSHGDALSFARLPATGSVSTIEGNDGRAWHYGYSGEELSSYEDPEGQKTSYTYNAAGLLHVVEEPGETFVITYDESSPARVTSVRRLVNGTVAEAGSEDEITSFEYVPPTAPECNPEIDVGETVVRYQPGEEETEFYCYNAKAELTRTDAASGAGNCSRHGHNHYGEACLESNFDGVSTTIQSAALSVSNPEEEFVDNDMWIVNQHSSPVHWIEAGVIFGQVCTHGPENIVESGGCDAISIAKHQTLFWGYDRPGGEYWEHFGAEASLNTAYSDTITHQGHNEWSVRVGGLVGTSTSNPLQAHLIRTGTERSNTGGVTACSEQYNLEWEGTRGIWHEGWGGAKLQMDKPPYGEWVSTNHWLRDREHDPTCYGLE